MKNRLTKIWRWQAGFSLLEVLISLAIVGVMGAGVSAFVSQTFQQNGRASNGMQAIEQVENAAYWLNHDAPMTQIVTLSSGSGFPLSLNWQDTSNNMNQATYSISGGNLQRVLTVTSLDGRLISTQQNTAASKINSNPAKTFCSYANGVLNFQITATSGTTTQTRNYRVKLRIDQPSSYLTITTPSLPSGYTGRSYNQTINAIGGTTPYTWTKTAGNLPIGLSLTTSGVFSGTPNVGISVITYTFTVQVTDNQNNKATQDFSIIMNPLDITTPSLPEGQKGKNYGSDVPKTPVSIVAVGGTAPYIWSIASGNLPPGLSLNSSTGLISGIPDSTTGQITYSFTVTVTDFDGNIKSKSLSIYIRP